MLEGCSEGTVNETYILKSLPVKVLWVLCVVVVPACVTRESCTHVAFPSPAMVQDSCTMTRLPSLDTGAEKSSMNSALVIVRIGTPVGEGGGAGEDVIGPFTIGAVSGPVHCDAMVIVCEQTLTIEAANEPDANSLGRKSTRGGTSVNGSDRFVSCDAATGVVTRTRIGNRKYIVRE